MCDEKWKVKGEIFEGCTYIEDNYGSEWWMVKGEIFKGCNYIEDNYVVYSEKWNLWRLQLHRR